MIQQTQVRHSENQTQNQGKFTKGMTLDQYIIINNLVNNNQSQQVLFQSLIGDLEIEPHFNPKLETFEIQEETDQDNYEESREQLIKHRKTNFIKKYDGTIASDEKQNLQLNSQIQLQPVQKKRGNTPIAANNIKPNSKTRQFSKSPQKKQMKTPQMFRSLYGGEFMKKQKEDIDNLHTTLYPKVTFPNQKRKDQTYFQKKNKKQYKEIQEYENMIVAKYGLKYANEMATVFPHLKNQNNKDRFSEKKRTITIYNTHFFKS